MYSIQRELGAGYVGHDGVVKRDLVIGQALSPRQNARKGRSLPPFLGLLILVALVLTGTFWTVRAAQTALPGDAGYPLKQWIREQRLSLAPADQLGKAIAENEKELAADIQALARRLQEDGKPGKGDTEAMVYYGRNGDLLMIGPFLVVPNFQPVAGVEDFQAMEIQGSLVPGAVVQLTYKVLPGNPNVVQGVRAVVVDGPKLAPTPALAGTRGCQAKLPSFWVPYAVRPGDTLTNLADRTGVSVVEITGVNCLDTASLSGVSQLYLPQSVYVRVTPTGMPMQPTPTSP